MSDYGQAMKMLASITLQTDGSLRVSKSGDVACWLLALVSFVFGVNIFAVDDSWGSSGFTSRRSKKRRYSRHFWH